MDVQLLFPAPKSPLPFMIPHLFNGLEWMVVVPIHHHMALLDTTLLDGRVYGYVQQLPLFRCPALMCLIVHGYFLTAPLHPNSRAKKPFFCSVTSFFMSARSQ